MAYDWTSKADLAERLIAKFGTSATLHQTSVSGDAWSPSVSNSDISVTIVDLERDVRDASGTLIETGKRTLLMSTAEGVTPQREDKVTVGGTKHEIDHVETLAPGGTVIMWKIHLAQ